MRDREGGEMSDWRKVLEQAMTSPGFMEQVRQAVLESPLVQAKDAEIARLRERAETAEAREAVMREALRMALSVALHADGCAWKDYRANCDCCVAHARAALEGERK